MSLTLFVEPGNFRAFKILIAAEYNNVTINIPAFNLKESNKTSEFLKISPLGRVPALSTPEGNIFESNAIARYIARMRNDTGLYGKTFFESAEIDQWIDFTSHNVELPASIWFYPVLGYMPANASAIEKSKADLLTALKVVESHLQLRTYLVGESVTLADITLASTLLYPFKFVCDPTYRAHFPNVMRWFETCVNQTQFEAVIGKVVLAASEHAANSGNTINVNNNNNKKCEKQQNNNNQNKENKEKKEKVQKEPKEQKPKEQKPKEAPKPKETKKETKKDDDEEMDDTPVEKKEDHLFKKMDETEKSPFVMDAWKRCYSNAENYDDAMKTFWETFDPKGWSIFRGDYNYNDELKVLFMTSNLVGGFIQRTDEIRKWLFGTMSIRGEEGKLMKITAYYLIRGQNIKPLIDCNDDAACYTWTKVAGDDVPVTEENKNLIKNYWTVDYDEMVEGEKCLASRCYK